MVPFVLCQSPMGTQPMCCGCFGLRKRESSVHREKTYTCDVTISILVSANIQTSLGLTSWSPSLSLQ